MNRSSTNKTSLSCIHFALCSGCTLSENLNEPPLFDEMRLYFKRHHIPSLPLFSKESEGWRGRAKLAVRADLLRGGGLLGLYQKGTHQVVDIPNCQVHHPEINKAAEKLRHFIRKEGIEPYDEVHYTGLLRYIQLTVERSSGKVQLVLVVNQYQKDVWEKIIPQLSLEYPWHSIWLNVNSRRDNVIFGKDWELLSGEKLFWEQIAGISICLHPASFVQANLALFETLISSLKAQIPLHTSLVEYYAGVGVIGLSLVDKCRQIICCEANPQAEESFNLSKAKLSFERQAKLAFVQAKAEKSLHLMELADAIVVDPPRKGLDAALLKALTNQKGAKRLFYISCGWEGFQRDCDFLLEKGWKIQQVEGYLLFPGTNHIELLVTFVLQDSLQ